VTGANFDDYTKQAYADGWKAAWQRLDTPNPHQGDARKADAWERGYQYGLRFPAITPAQWANEERRGKLMWISLNHRFETPQPDARADYFESTGGVPAPDYPDEPIIKEVWDATARFLPKRELEGLWADMTYDLNEAYDLGVLVKQAALHGWKPSDDLRARLQQMADTWMAESYRGDRDAGEYLADALALAK
jgi:hypothetical protein